MAIQHVAPFRFAPAFRALGVFEHIWLRYKIFDPSCFDPIQNFGTVDLRTDSDFRSRSFDLFPPTLKQAIGVPTSSNNSMTEIIAGTPPIAIRCETITARFCKKVMQSNDDLERCTLETLDKKSNKILQY